MCLENKYDDPVFFEKYAQMDRSRLGLEGAGEWQTLQAMIPPLQGKDLLDLGCGYGWHCRYAVQQGAKSVVGVDLSEKMLRTAREKTHGMPVCYLHMPMEEIDFAPERFDGVLSSLALHYVEKIEPVFQKVYQCLRPGGFFLMNVEHPVFTAQGSQDWVYGPDGEKLFFPVDRYFDQGARSAVFLGETVTKYHRTLTAYIRALRAAGFELRDLQEPMPGDAWMQLPGMRDELRRPMMLILLAEKPLRPR